MMNDTTLETLLRLLCERLKDFSADDVSAAGPEVLAMRRFRLTATFDLDEGVLSIPQDGGRGAMSAFALPHRKAVGEDTLARFGWSVTARPDLYLYDCTYPEALETTRAWQRFGWSRARLAVSLLPDPLVEVRALFEAIVVRAFRVGVPGLSLAVQCARPANVEAAALALLEDQVEVQGTSVERGGVRSQWVSAALARVAFAARVVADPHATERERVSVPELLASAHHHLGHAPQPIERGRVVVRVALPHARGVRRALLRPGGGPLLAVDVLDRDGARPVQFTPDGEEHTPSGETALSPGGRHRLFLDDLPRGDSPEPSR